MGAAEGVAQAEPGVGVTGVVAPAAGVAGQVESVVVGVPVPVTSTNSMESPVVEASSVDSVPAEAIESASLSTVGFLPLSRDTNNAAARRRRMTKRPSASFTSLWMTIANPFV